MRSLLSKYQKERKKKPTKKTSQKPRNREGERNGNSRLGLTQPGPWRQRLLVSATPGLTIAKLSVLLLITLGGEQREQCKIGREGRGEGQGFPAISYSVYRGRAAAARRSQEGKQRSRPQLPRRAHLHPQAAAEAAAQEHHDGHGEGHRPRWNRPCGPARTAPGAPGSQPHTPRGAFPATEPDTHRGRRRGKGAGSSPRSRPCPGASCLPPPGPPPPFALSGSDSLAPRETLGHSGFLSFHRGNSSRPGRVGGAGERGRVGEKKGKSC